MDFLKSSLRGRLKSKRYWIGFWLAGFLSLFFLSIASQKLTAESKRAGNQNLESKNESGNDSRNDNKNDSEGEKNQKNCKHDKRTFRCVKYLKNYDADTLTVEIPGQHPLFGENISVRVNGIDSPEIKTHDSCEKQAARTAQRLVENLLKNSNQIDLLNVERDKYFRVLADVSVDGKLIKDILLSNNLAYEYHGETKKKVDWCKVSKSVQESRLPANTKL